MLLLYGKCKWWSASFLCSQSFPSRAHAFVFIVNNAIMFVDKRKDYLQNLKYLQTIFLRQFLIEGYHQNSQLFSQNFIYDVDHFNEMLLLFAMVQFAEILGGYLAGSLAIMSDAAHLLSDCISFIVALLAIVWAKKSPNNHMTFGYKRIGMFEYIF